MANQITIDIVAQTNKLTSGINDANGQIDTMSTKLKGIAGAAGIAASGFLATKGLTFLKQSTDEAREAEETLRAATTTFGEGSAALAQITADADKFAKVLSVDNDELIALATQLGSRLPKDIQGSSVELVKIFKDVEAFTGGAVSAEAASGKLAKAFADGELKAGELSKIFPGLEQATYDQAEALSKAGDNQGALNLLVDKGSVVYDDAAAKNVTASQKFNKALGDLKEQIGGPVLQIVNKLVEGLTFLLTAFSSLPGPVQNIIIALGLLLVTGALTLTFLASMKASLVTLGIVNGTTAGSIGLVTIATNLLKIALAGIGIGLLIAAIVLLVKNWDTVVEVAEKVKDAIFEFFGKAFEFVKEAIGKAIEWVKENWPLILAILTGPIGLAILAITKNFDKIKDKVGEVLSNIKNAFSALPGAMLEIGKDIVEGLWNGIKGMMSWVQNKIENSFVGKIIGQVNNLFGRKSPSKVFAGIGKDLVKGLWVGVNGQKTYIKNNFDDFFGDIIPSLTVDSLNLPDFSTFITEGQLTDAIIGSSPEYPSLAGTGLDWDAVNEQFAIDDTVVTTAKLADLMNSNYSIPSLSPSQSSVGTYNITINAGAGSDPYSVGRAVTSAIDKYSRISSATGQRVTL